MQSRLARQLWTISAVFLSMQHIDTRKLDKFMMSLARLPFLCGVFPSRFCSFSWRKAPAPRKLLMGVTYYAKALKARSKGRHFLVCKLWNKVEMLAAKSQSNTQDLTSALSMLLHAPRPLVFGCENPLLQRLRNDNSMSEPAYI